MTHPFTPTYIEMAKAVEEIQTQWTPQRGDYVHQPLFEGGASLPAHFDWLHEPGMRKPWLPRLDQLLGMLGKPMDFMMYAEKHTRDWFDTEPAALREDWHELVLSMVMREKYGKKWDGNAWVKA